MFVGYALAETTHAVLLQDHFWHAPDWFPKSQVRVYRDTDTAEVRFSPSPFICGKKPGLDEFKEWSPQTDDRR